MFASLPNDADGVALGLILASVSCSGIPKADDPSSTGETTSDSDGAEGATTGTASGGTAVADETGDAPACIAEGEFGGEPGQVIPPLIVSRCDGSDTSLQELVCGNPVTLFDFGGAGFQMCVDATVEYATSPEYDALQAKGLGIVQVFALDDVNQPPTTSFCTEYSETHAVDFEFLIDRLGATHTLASMYPLNLVVDERGVVIHQWALDIPPDKIEILDALLDAAQ